MTDITLYQLALFNTEPKVGDINPPGEVDYEGYERIQAAFIGGTLQACVFPKCKSAGPFLVTHMALMTFDGRVVDVKEVTDKNIF